MLSTNACFQYPGPNEQGNYWITKKTSEYKSCFHMWFRPDPSVQLVHPDTVKLAARTAELKSQTNGSLFFPPALAW